MVDGFGIPKFVQAHFNKLLIGHYCLTFLSFISIFLCVVEFEWDIEYGQGSYDLERYVILSSNVIVTICILISLCFVYHLKVLWL